MNFGGTIYLCDDMQMATQLSLTHKIVCVSGESHNFMNFINSTNALNLPVLLPPPEASMMLIDGDMKSFVDSYFNHLSQYDIFTYLLLIIKSVCDGNNIILFNTKDETSLGYMNILSNYLSVVFGMIPGNSETQFMFNSGFIPNILKLLYVNNIISAYEFLYYMPLQYQLIDNNEIVKLVNDFRLTNTITLDEAKIHFNLLKNKLKNTNGEFITPFEGVV